MVNARLWIKFWLLHCVEFWLETPACTGMKHCLRFYGDLKYWCVGHMDFLHLKWFLSSSHKLYITLTYWNWIQQMTLRTISPQWWISYLIILNPSACRLSPSYRKPMTSWQRNMLKDTSIKSLLLMKGIECTSSRGGRASYCLSLWGPTPSWSIKDLLKRLPL